MMGLFVAVVFGMAGCGGAGENAQNNKVTAAEAGPAQNVVAGNPVTLDGSQSTGADGSLITYQWSMVSKPVGSAATINNPTTINPTFMADLPGQYTIKLIVTDAKSITSEDSITVTVTASVANAAPVANAGIAQNVVTGTLVTLNGSASSDANGDPLTYSWTLTSKPTGSTAALLSATSATPTFTADLAGTYVATLVVNDGQVNSTAAPVTITANAWISPIFASAVGETIWGGTWYTGPASFAIDGNNITAWTYNGLGRITFDLGAVYLVSGISAYWGGSVTNGNTVNIYVDGVQVVTESQFGSTTNVKTFNPASGRYVVYETVPLPHNQYLQIATWSEIAEFKVLARQ